MVSLPDGFWNRKKRIEMIITTYRALQDTYLEKQHNSREISYNGKKVIALEIVDPQLLKAKRVYQTIPEIKATLDNPYHFRRKKYHSQASLSEFDFYI